MHEKFADNNSSKQETAQESAAIIAVNFVPTSVTLLLSWLHLRCGVFSLFLRCQLKLKAVIKL